MLHLKTRESDTARGLETLSGSIAGILEQATANMPGKTDFNRVSLRWLSDVLFRKIL